MNGITVLARVIAAPVQDEARVTCRLEIPEYKPGHRPTQIIAWVSEKAGWVADALAKVALDDYLILEGSLRVESGLTPELRISGISQVHPVDMPGVNRIALVGRAGRDPEVRYFESGSCVTNVTLAVKRPGAKPDPGKDQPDPDWFNLAIWGKQAQVAADYVRKGSLVGIIGRFELDHWTDRTTGEERSKPVVHVDDLRLLGSRRDSEQHGGGEPSPEEVPF
jgi:single-strand DNA-binding protein